MFRTARRITPLLSSLALGAVAASGVAITTGVLAGCADENDPATHVKKLDDAATRAQAVNRLIQFYEDKMTQDKGDRNGPAVKPLLELIVKPMTERCVAGDLDDRTNTKLIKFLADTRDPQSEPCIVKALKDYKPDQTEEDVRAAARAVKALKLKTAAQPLMDVFTKMKASKPKAQATYLDVNQAMLELQDPGWETQLVNMLAAPVDPKDQAGLNDQMFWQTTAAQVLGDMKSANAVKALIKIVLSPYKVAAQTTAILGLVKIGKPAIAPAIALLKGEDKDLVDYAKGEYLKAATASGEKGAEKSANSAHVGPAALILATIGREESGAALIETVAKSEDAARAIIARELTKLPRSPATEDAFKAAFEKTSLTLSLPGAGQNAREVLLESSGYFFDNSFIPWMAKIAKEMKGEEADVEPLREATLQTMLKLCNSDQLKLVDELFNQKATIDGKPSTVGKSFEKEYKITKELLGACGDKVDCYVGKLTDPASQAEATQFQGIKSAYMIGSLGNEAVRPKLVEALPKIQNGAVRFLTVTLIDFLSPKGDKDIAAKLQKMLDDAQAAKDQDKVRAYSPFKTVIYRLNARAQ